MTPQEVKQRLEKIWKDYTSAYDSISEDDVMAFDMAIEALQAQELNETQKPLDTISKQAAIDAVLKLTYADGAYGYADAKELVDILEALPSAQAERPTDIQDILTYLDNVLHPLVSPNNWHVYSDLYDMVAALPSAEPEIIRCKDCKHWRQQTNYQGVLLSFGFCESDDMWVSLYGETCEVEHIDTADNHYCGYAERRTDD